MNYLNESAQEDNGGTAAGEGTQGSPDMSATEVPEPKSGGSYVRDPDTGALTQVAGPVPDNQPTQE